MINNNETVLLLPDGRIAQNRKEAKELLGIGSTIIKMMFRSNEIKRISKPVTQCYESASKSQ